MSDSDSTNKQSDRLMWALSGGVGLAALVTIVVLNSGNAPQADPNSRDSTEASLSITDATSNTNDIDARTEDQYAEQLNRAQLALNAGMLIEPEGFSAWSIYTQLLEENPQDAQALAGIEEVADTLVRRASDALAAGNKSDAVKWAERVLEQFPDRRDAAEILTRQNNAVRQLATANPVDTKPNPRPVLSTTPTINVAAPRALPNPEPVRATVSRTDPIAEIYPSFTEALAADKLTAPDVSNASEILAKMRVLSVDHATTIDAEQQLLDAILKKHLEAFDALDTDAAHRWLDAAEQLNIDNALVENSRAEVSAFESALAAQDSILATDLSLLNYVAPTYPSAALRRGTEGWVDVTFVLDSNGNPTNIETIDSSHKNLFNEAALAAVEQWQFEPYRIMNRVVEQQTHTRIRFALE